MSMRLHMRAIVYAHAHTSTHVQQAPKIHNNKNAYAGPHTAVGWNIFYNFFLY